MLDGKDAHLGGGAIEGPLDCPEPGLTRPAARQIHAAAEILRADDGNPTSAKFLGSRFGIPGAQPGSLDPIAPLEKCTARRVVLGRREDA